MASDIENTGANQLVSGGLGGPDLKRFVSGFFSGYRDVNAPTLPVRNILEIGCGVQPFFTGHERRQLLPNERYVGIDLKKLPEPIQGYDTKHYVLGDATALPFADEAFYEVVMVNVLGDASISHEVRCGIVDEAARVVRNMGRLTVVESYTPQIMPLEELVQSITGLGLEYTLANPKRAREYTNCSRNLRGGDYIAYFIKTRYRANHVTEE